jgi:hypothetical protein
MKSGWNRLVLTAAAGVLVAGLWAQGAGAAVTNESRQTTTFNGNGGTPAGQTNEYAAGQAYGELPEASRTGHSFGGWWTARSGGEQVAATNIVGDEATRTLWAHWTANQYDVELDAQGGDGGAGTVSATYGQAMPAVDVPEREGFAFGGYYSATNGGGTRYYTAAGKSARSWNVASNATLYAKWSAIACRVTLDRQGGSGGEASVTATYGSEMPATAVPTRTGHTFAGYFSEMDGAGTPYYTAEGKSARVWDGTTNATLYAKWTVNSYKVTLDPQGGEDGTEETQATYGSEMPEIDPPTRTGYTFEGYYSRMNGAGTPYYTAEGTSAQAWDQAAPKTLYAKWTANSYTVTLDQQEGEGGSEEATATYGKAMPGIEVPTRTGYSFGGYCDGPDGAGTRYYTAEGQSARGWNVASNATLYAKWTANAYRVALDRQGGTGGAASATAAYGNAMPEIQPPTRTGHTFGGYFSEMDGAGTQYYMAEGQSARAWDVATNATLYALWTVNSYTVALDHQGGKGGTAKATATYGSEMPEITVPTRKGYTFGGYYGGTKGAGAQYYTAEGQGARVWNVASNTTLYAQWTANSYDVTLDMQGGTGEMASVTATYGKAMPTIKVPSRKGYTFGGYYSKKKGAGTQYYTAEGQSARTWNGATNATLYAQWTANSYKVTLNRQGGKGGSASATATYAQAMPEIEVPARKGYTFGGYYSATNGGGTRYYTAEGASARKWNKDAATTLYAKWTANSYTVTLDPQEGEGGTEEATATYAGAMPEIEVPTRTGYTFGGYYSATNGSGTRYYTPEGASARVWNVASNATLFAKWTANSYDVTLDMQGGTGEVASVTATYGKAMPAINSPKRKGYTFGGYYSKKKGAGTPYYTSAGRSAQAWNVASNATLYAKWTATSYTVTLNRQGGKGGSASATATYAQAMPEIEVPVRTGYTFGGYYSATNGGGTRYYTAQGASARKWNKAAATTLYAKWTANSYTVTLDPQEGEGGTEETTATYGSAMPEIEVPTRTGHTFGGYYSATNGGGTRYYTPEGQGARAWNLASNATLYAKWKANAYTITLDRQGGTGGTVSTTATYGSAMPAISVPSRKGYTFDGYYTAADGGGTRYYTAAGKGERTWDVATNTTLYAKWTANEEGTAETAGAKRSAGREAEVATTTSDGSDGSAVVDGDESTGWAPEGTEAVAWVVLSFAETRDVAEVEVVGENLPDGMRVLLSEDAEEWFEGEGGTVRYVWVAFPEATEGMEVREVRVLEERE